MLINCNWMPLIVWARSLSSSNDLLFQITSFLCCHTLQKNDPITAYTTFFQTLEPCIKLSCWMRSSIVLKELKLKPIAAESVSLDFLWASQHNIRWETSSSSLLHSLQVVGMVRNLATLTSVGILLWQICHKQKECLGLFSLLQTN